MGLGMIVADLLEFQGVLFGIWRSSQECSFGFMFHLSLLYSTGVIFIFLDKLVPICVIPRARFQPSLVSSHTEAGFGCCSLRVGRVSLG